MKLLFSPKNYYFCIIFFQFISPLLFHLQDIIEIFQFSFRISGQVGKWLDKKANVNFKTMTSQAEEQTVKAVYTEGFVWYDLYSLIRF